MKRLLLLAIASLMSTIAFSAAPEPDTPTAPIAPRQDHVLRWHGEDVNDPWYWLRDKDSAPVLDHLKRENAYTQAAGLFSVVFDEAIAPAKVDAFIDALTLFGIGFSWAGPVSLAVPYDLRLLRPNGLHRGALVRFSIGLEAVEDLQADCEQALQALTSTELGDQR